jgi:hypothetical protein
VTGKSDGFPDRGGGETGSATQPRPPSRAETHPQILLTRPTFTSVSLAVPWAGGLLQVPTRWRSGATTNPTRRAFRAARCGGPARPRPRSYEEGSDDRTGPTRSNTNLT